MEWLFPSCGFFGSRDNYPLKDLKMKRMVFTGLAFIVSVSMVFGNVVVFAQQQQRSHSEHVHDAYTSHVHEAHGAHEHCDHQHAVETLAYTLPEWKTIHFDDAAKAAQLAETVMKLGCEVKQVAHVGHTDLSYRCAQWKTISLESRPLAEQWTNWLKSSGFDVSHGNVAPKYSQGPEVVEFRLVHWTLVHGKGGEYDRQFTSRLKELGVEVRVNDQGNHSDIQYRSPVWKDVHLADHESAKALSAWMVKQGFEIAPHKY
jgi:hypothetical protein